VKCIKTRKQLKGAGYTILHA